MKDTNESLFERIGGMDAVNAAVDVFYKKVISDPMINHFFENVDIEKQSTKLKSFVAYACGAPMKYSGKQMAEAHAHMSIKEEHFNSVAGHLSDTLTQLGLDSELVQEVMEVVGSTQNDIVNS